MMVPPDSFEEPRVVRVGRGDLFLSSLFVLSMAFDYKGVEGGSVFQYAMAVLNTSAFLLLAFKHRLSAPRSGLPSFVFWSWMSFLLVGSAGALASDVQFDRYIRTIYPFVLFAEGFLVAWWVARNRYASAALVRSMFLVSLISFVFSFWWGFDFSGRTLETIRFQILSPTIPFLLVASGFDLIIASRSRLRSFVIMVAVLAAIFISVTRGMLLVIAMVLLVTLAAQSFNLIRGQFTLPRPFSRAIVWGALLGMSGILLIAAEGPGVFQRWMHRTTGPASGVNFWTRIAAVVGQWHQLASNPASWILGRGFGQSYLYARSFASLILPFSSPEKFSAARWFPGEFMWMSFVYYGGLLTGTLVIIALVWVAVRALGTLSELVRRRAWRLPHARPLWIGALGYFAFLGLGFTANPFIIRLSALFLGLTLGLVLAVARSLPLNHGNNL